MKRISKLKGLVLTSMFAALCCVATMVVQIPTPTGGFLHLGDAMVLLCGWMLGPVWGALAAGIGSMLADVFSGYVLYAPATLLIEGAVAGVPGNCIQEAFGIIVGAVLMNLMERMHIRERFLFGSQTKC